MKIQIYKLSFLFFVIAPVAIIFSIIFNNNKVYATVSYPTLASSTTLTLNNSEITAGQVATFTTKVTGTGGSSNPTGTVTFQDGSNILGSVPVDNSEQAVFSTASLTVGVHSIEAAYSGDSNYTGSSSNTQNITIDPQPKNTSINLTSSNNTITLGQTINFIAKATSSDNSTVNGTVSFKDGSNIINTSNLDSSGQASFSTTTLTQGSHTITATYNGNNQFNSSTSNTVNINVNPATIACTINVIANTTYARPGDNISLTVNVTGGSITPTGKVNFKDDQNSLATLNLDNTAQVVYKISTLAAGTHNISASYAGDTTYDPCTSNVISLTIDSSLINSLTTVTADNTSITQGQKIFLTAKVVNNSVSSTSSVSSTNTLSTLIPTGSVTFKNGTNVLGTASLDNTGTAIFTTSNLDRGDNEISAQYSGDKNFNGSTSAPLSIVASPAQGNSNNSLLIPILAGIIMSAITAAIIYFGRKWQLRKKKTTLENNPLDQYEHVDMPEKTLPETEQPKEDIIID